MEERKMSGYCVFTKFRKKNMKNGPAEWADFSVHDIRGKYSGVAGCLCSGIPNRRGLSLYQNL